MSEIIIGVDVFDGPHVEDPDISIPTSITESIEEKEENADKVNNF